MGVVVRRPSLYGHWRRGHTNRKCRTRTISIGLVEGQDVTCTFINTLQTGTLTVIKHVINNDGGSASASNWSIHVQQSGSEVTGSPQAGAESPGTSYTLPGGSYTVSETGTPTTYAFQGFSGDCDAERRRHGSGRRHQDLHAHQHRQHPVPQARQGRHQQRRRDGRRPTTGI